MHSVWMRKQYLALLVVMEEDGNIV